jgi:Zn-dependent membrane protease YugP
MIENRSEEAHHVFDLVMIYILPAMLVMMLVQWYVNSAITNGPGRPQSYERCSGPAPIRRAGCMGRIEPIGGRLSDHYDRDKVLAFLRRYSGSSVATL